MGRECKKCGSDKLSIKHVHYGHVYDTSSYDKIEDEFRYSIEYEIFFKVKARKEHLNITCKTCNYIWLENVKE